MAVAKSVRLALAGELVPDAVNVAGGLIAEDLRPGIPLTEHLGRVFTALAGGVAQQLDVEVRGAITHSDVSVLRPAPPNGRFTAAVTTPVPYAHPPFPPPARGIERIPMEPPLQSVEVSLGACSL
mgnify:CR=1 FL=1